MRSRLVAALAATALTIPLLGSNVATAAGPSLPGSASDTAAERAADALARAQALFTEKTPVAARRQAATDGRSASLILNELRQARTHLSPTDRRAADALLARPTGNPAFPGEWQYKVKEKKPVCGKEICIHYVGRTADAPPLRDKKPKNGIPDAVDRALRQAERVNKAYVDAGYRRPDRDKKRGGNNKLDVYLNNIGDYGIYGYCTTDQKPKTDGTSNYWAYCVIDDDFSKEEFPTNTPRENQQVTLAHEYFHAVQYAYDADEASWFLEATATWAEDELYDRVNDSWNYLPFGQMGKPWIPLDTFRGLVQYGNWVFFRYLTETYRDATGGIPNLVRELIERGSNRTGEPDATAMQALQQELKERGTTLSEIYREFAVANRTPRAFYSEGRHYSPAKPTQTFVLSASKRGTGVQGTKLRHLSNKTLRFKPGAGVTKPTWKIRIKVDMQPQVTQPSAHVLVYRKNGTIGRSTIKLGGSTAGSKVVSFGARRIKHVDLLLVNASARSNRGKTKFTARIFR